MLSARKYAPHRQRRLRSATLYPTELRTRCYGINDLRGFRPFCFAYALHNRQTQEISRPEFVWATGSIVLWNSALILYTTRMVAADHQMRKQNYSPIREMDGD